MVLAEVRSTIDQHRMIERGECVLAAVSGGVDSIVLLDVLTHLSAEYGFEVHVAHIDHAIRGEASRADADFVERRVRNLGLPFVGAAMSPEALDQHRRLGTEGAAREERKALLLGLAGQVGAAKIALGHTASDSAETVLHHLVRGAGGAGLRGIPPMNPPFIRPLIRLTRTEILGHAASRGLTWREDGSNTDLGYTRNRLRHRVLPELERINPQAVDAILRASNLVEDLHRVGERVVAESWASVASSDDGEGVVLSRRALGSLHPEIQRLLVREAIARVRGDLLGIERMHVEAIRALTDSDRAHGELSLPGLHVRMQGDQIALMAAQPAPIEPWSMPIDIGRTEVPRAELTLELARVDRSRDNLDSRPDRWTEIADADRMTFPLEVRSRRDGDRFVPLGLGKETKLKDFLINERIPYFDRDRLALLCDRDRVLWVIGVRLSHEVRVTDRTRSVLVMHAEGPT